MVSSTELLVMTYPFPGPPYKVPSSRIIKISEVFIRVTPSMETEYLIPAATSTFTDILPLGDVRICFVEAPDAVIPKHRAVTAIRNILFMCDI